jgi:phage replication O-like protein O
MEPYTKFPNAVLDRLPGFRLPPTERAVFDVIARQTWGWGKEEDAIALSQFSCVLGGVDRANIHRAIKALEASRIIVVNRDNKRRPKFLINRDVSKWEMLSLRTTRRKLRKGVVTRTYNLLSAATTHRSPRVQQPMLSPVTPSKETTKENLKKEKESARPLASDGARARASEPEGKMRSAAAAAERQRRNGIANVMVKSGLYSEDEMQELWRGRTAEDLEILHGDRMLAAGRGFADVCTSGNIAGDEQLSEAVNAG